LFGGGGAVIESDNPFAEDVSQISSLKDIVIKGRPVIAVGFDVNIRLPLAARLYVVAPLSCGTVKVDVVESELV